MNSTTRSLPFLLSCGLLITSCATMQPTADVRDDVYYLPSMEPMAAATSMAPVEEAPETRTTDDYYDPATSQQLGADRSYYDMAYNDPYYYNYGRFGFGTGIPGYQSGWNGPGWGMGMGYGYGMRNCWGYGYGNGLGWGGGWSNPWSSPWNDPYSPYGGWYNDPFNGGWNSSYGYGYGYGNYMSPYGNCYSCYAPVIIGGSSNVVVGQRPSMGSGSGIRTSPSPRIVYRDPVRLSPTPAQLQRSRVGDRKATGLDPARERRLNDTYRRSATHPERVGNSGRSPGGTRTPERTFDQGRTFDGGSSSPSRSGGSGGGGGTRTSPSRR